MNRILSSYLVIFTLDTKLVTTFSNFLLVRIMKKVCWKYTSQGLSSDNCIFIRQSICYINFSIFYFHFYYIVMQGYIVMFTKVLRIYQSWIHPLHHSPSLPLLIPGIVSTGLIFSFTYMYTQYLCHIHPPSPSPYILSIPTGTKSLDRICSAPHSLTLFFLMTFVFV
jgi:hypothetical protein